MNWHFNPLLLLPLSSALLAAFLCRAGWQRRFTNGAPAFSLVMLAVAIWALGNAIELGATDLSTKVFWLGFEYIGILLSPAAWLVFALQVTDHGHWFSRRILLLLTIEPIIIFVLLLTSQFHHLFLELNVRTGVSFPLQWDTVGGPFFWINIIYSYCLFLLGGALLLVFLSQAKGKARGGELVIIAGVILPWAANVLSFFYVLPIITGIDLTPIALSLTGLAFGWAVFRLHLLEVRPGLSDFPEELAGWRSQVLDGVLRGIFIIWLIALVGGINNVMDVYNTLSRHYASPLISALSVISIFVATTVLLTLITFNGGLRYNLRAGLLIFILYVLGTTGLLNTALSGDGRIFFFALVILTAILFDLIASLSMLALTLVTYVAIGWLQITELIVVPVALQANATDPAAWLSGAAVFLTLSIAVLTSASFLLRTLGRSLDATRESLSREQRLALTLRTLSNINQLIVREQSAPRLLQQICDELLSSHGYSFVWVGLIAADGVTLKLAASAGEDQDPSLFTTRLDQEKEGLACAVLALRREAPVEISSSPQENLCPNCPRLARHPRRAAVALPLTREGRKLGVLVVDHANPAGVFLAEEIKLLSELADDIGYALEKIEADRRLQLHVRHQTLLADLTRVSLKTSSMADMLGVMTERLREALSADGCYMTVWDSSGTLPLPAAASGYLSETFVQVRASEDEIRIAHILREKETTIAAEDVSADPHVSPRIAELLSIHSLLAVPMTANGVNLGGIFLTFHQRRAFPPEEITFMEQAGSQVALAIAKGRLDEEIHARATELEQLYTTAQDIAASLLDPPELLVKLARHVTDALDVTSCSVLGVDPAEGLFAELAEYCAHGARPAERMDEIGKTFAMEKYPTVVQAILEGRTLLLHRNDANLSATERNQFFEYDVQSMLFVPLLSRGRLLGDLELWESRRRREFTPAEIQLAQAIAAHAASIIESAQLFAQTRQRESELASLLNVARSVSSSLDIRDVLRDAATSMAAILRADYCVVSEYDPQARSVKIIALYTPDGAVDESPHCITAFSLAHYPSMARVIESGVAAVIHADTQSDQPEQQFLREDNQAACLMLPLRTGSRALGLAELYTSDPAREFTEADIRLARALADQISVAIDNASLYTKMERSEAYFRALSENSAEGVAIIDSNGIFTYITPTEERILGYDPKQVIGLYAFEIVHPEDLPRASSALQSCIREPGSLVTVDYRARHVDGTWRHLEVTLNNLLHEPSVRGVVANFRDITERSQAAEALSRSEAYFRALVENAAEGVAILDAEGNFTYVVHKEQPMTGYTYEETIGGSVFRHVHPDDLPGLVKAFQEGMQTPNSIITREYRLQRKDGSWGHYEVTGHNLLHDPHIAGIVINYRDITERKLAEQAVEKHADELALAYDNTLAGWARALELRDELTEGHTRRVTELTLTLARALNVSEDELAHIRRGSLLHDIGKMGIPDSILHKPGALTAQEQRIMQLHPQYAFEMLSLIPFLRPALDIPYCHHEHWNGRGYPRGLKGVQIPLSARIFAVVDVWDALTSDRPYRKAWPREQAREYLVSNSGTQFDPEIVKTFLDMLEEGL
ncbi:MAG: GAF domain-containing protein [Chloroflexi bacterium]|nr:GAF domain-containing protein [Chloroflexota bacterium]